jgi:hypothetical protein
MKEFLDIFQIGSCNRFFTIRMYRAPLWGTRRLGKGRFAVDTGRISFIFENYNP